MMRLSDDEVVLGDDYAFYYQGKPYNGVVYDNRADGSLLSENTYTSGWRNGESMTWYPDGQLKLKTPYTMGWVHGLEEAYFPGGEVQRRTQYEHSIRTLEQEFDRAGRRVRAWAIDPGSREYARLEAARRNEPQRLEKIFAIYGRPPPEEG